MTWKWCSQDLFLTINFTNYLERKRYNTKLQQQYPGSWPKFEPLASLNIQQNCNLLDLDFRWTFYKLTDVNKQTNKLTHKSNIEHRRTSACSNHSSVRATTALHNRRKFLVLHSAHAHISRSSIRRSSNPHVWYEGPARVIGATWQHFSAFVCCLQLLRCSEHLHQHQTATLCL